MRKFIISQPLNNRMKVLDLLESVTLTEITLSPSVLQSWGQSAQAAEIRAGFEAELVVPVEEELEDADPEPDYSDDPRADDIDQIVDFFSESSFGMGRSEAARLHTRMKQDFEMYVEQTVDNHMSGADLDDQIASLARADGMEQADIDAMLEKRKRERRNEDYAKYNGQLRDQLITQAYGQVSEKDWLRSIGIDTMSDAENEYDLTWPIWSVPNAGTAQVEIGQVAGSIARTLGVHVVPSTTYHTAPRVADAWVLEPDSSIKVSDPTMQAGLELVTPSPPFTLPETLTYLDKTFAWAKAYGCETNRSTGFHMSMSLPPEVHDKLDPIKLILLLGDTHMLSEFGRIANTYAESAFDIFVKHVKDQDRFHVKSALDALRKGLFSLAKTRVGIPFMNKYISVHIKPNYVEFRHAGGDYLDQLDQIKNTMLRMAYVMSIAADDTQARPDYARKLYKLLSGFIRPGHTDAAINLFSLYNAGIINADVLKSNIQQLRQELIKSDK